jgi:cation diffusion facilitator family transporter
MLVAIFKIIIGIATKSTSITADAFTSVADGLSNVIAVLGIYFASKPEDENHPYGHAKIETVASLLIGLFLAYTGIKVMMEAIDKIKNPVHPDITAVSIVVMIFTLIVNGFVSYYEQKKGEELGSSILVSDALHTRSDIYVTIGVLITLFLIKTGAPVILDSIASIIISLLIFKTAYDVFVENTNVLIDARVVDNELIKETVFKNYESVKEIHKIRSRGTQNNIFIDMHVQVDPDMNVRQSHTLMHDIEKTIQKDINSNAHVIIHIEPYSGKDDNSI